MPELLNESPKEVVFFGRSGLVSTNKVVTKKIANQVYLIRILQEDGDNSVNKVNSSLSKALSNKNESKRDLVKTSEIEHFHGQRLQMLGTMAGGVAHDFNNILTGILGHTSYLKAILPQKGDHIESLEAIESGARRSSIITQQILKFARTGEQDDISVCDLKQILTSTCILLKTAISKTFELNYQLPEEELLVMGVETKLSQIIANLVMNAKDAFEENGKIEVGVELVDDQTKVHRAYVNNPPKAKRFARIFVIDNGKGIPAELLERIFEPFFTTKKDKGTGLGLATVHNIVKSFRGAMEVSSKVGVGTSMSVYFPLYEPTKHESTPKEKTDVDKISDVAEKSFKESKVGRKIANNSCKKILIVDDEFPVRNVVAVSLKHFGFKVDTAESGEEALNLYLQALKADVKDEKYDLVIMDMLMPGMTGDELFVRLRMKDPNLRALIMSGYASEEALERVMMGGAKGFIQKPFTIEELMDKVGECW